MDHEIVKLKEIADFNKESMGKNSNYEFINYLDTANITNGVIDTIVRMPVEEAPSRAKRIVHNNDIIYSTVRPNLCHYGIIDSPVENMIVSTGFTVISCKNGINPYYVYNYLTQNDITSQLHSIAENSTSAYPSIKPSDLESIEINLPRLEIQNKIAKILTDIDRKMKLNNEINNNLYEFNNKLFEEKILNNAEKDDWEEYLLSDISKMINGYSYKGNELVEKSNIGMATIKNFERTGGFKLDGFKDIVPQKCKSDHYVKPFEILVACTDLTQNADIIGNAIMLLNNANYDEIIMSMDLVKLIPITDIVNNYMLYAIVNSRDFKNFALRYKSGTTVLHLNKNCFKEYTIKLPNYNTIKDLSKVFEDNYKKISQIVDENRKLEQLRDTLLPKLMNGEINLDNIDI